MVISIAYRNLTIAVDPVKCGHSLTACGLRQPAVPSRAGDGYVQGADPSERSNWRWRSLLLSPDFPTGVSLQPCGGVLEDEGRHKIRAGQRTIRANGLSFANQF